MELVFRSYTEDSLLYPIILYKFQKLIYMHFKLVRQHDAFDCHEICQYIIIQYYGSNETGFVEIRDSVPEGYFRTLIKMCYL